MADETICIRTAQGLICYANSTPRYYKKRKETDPEISIAPPPGTPDVNENSPWHEKLVALIHVAKHQADWEPETWKLITRRNGSPRSLSVREETPASSLEKLTWPAALVICVALATLGWVVTAGTQETIGKFTDYLINTVLPVVVSVVFGGAAGAFVGKTTAERTLRRLGAG